MSVIAYEYDDGAFWTLCTFYGWYTIMMSGNGEFGTFSTMTH